MSDFHPINIGFLAIPSTFKARIFKSEQHTAQKLSGSFEQGMPQNLLTAGNL